jgi:hypothetical protein
MFETSCLRRASIDHSISKPLPGVEVPGKKEGGRRETGKREAFVINTFKSAVGAKYVIISTYIFVTYI